MHGDSGVVMPHLNFSLTVELLRPLQVFAARHKCGDHARAARILAAYNASRCAHFPCLALCRSHQPCSFSTCSILPAPNP